MLCLQTCVACKFWDSTCHTQIPIKRKGSYLGLGALMCDLSTQEAEKRIVGLSPALAVVQAGSHGKRKKSFLP